MAIFTYIVEHLPITDLAGSGFDEHHPGSSLCKAASGLNL